MKIEDVRAAFEALPQAEREELIQAALLATGNLKWFPNFGPQSDAYFSLADVLLYGGEPGGGKSQLVLGLAFNEHKRSMILRRQYGDLLRLIEDALKINGGRRGFNGSPPPRLHIDAERAIYFRAAQRVGDEQGTMGHGRDLLGVDEATHFAESQIRFLMGWVRTEIPGQRCRTVLATNPPLTAEGLWVNKMFAPWLDERYPKPAKPGELRWCLSDADGKDEWVAGPDDTRTIRGKVIRPKSRTYIPASVRDNPYYAATDYERELDNLPEPFRSLLMGGFRTTFKDADYQVIPTAWIDLAMQRWTPDGWRDCPMTAMAIDPADGGEDEQVIAARHGAWFAPLQAQKGEASADPSQAFAKIMMARRDSAPVIVEMSGGFGGKISLRLADNNIPWIAFRPSGDSRKRAKGSKIPFANKRAESWFLLRDELDPNQDGGSAIALHPDPELKADLSAVCYDPHALQTRGVLQVEDKERLRKRLGRSPGKGDAVVICMSEGERVLAHMISQQQRSSMPATANVGYAGMKGYGR